MNDALEDGQKQGTVGACLDDGTVADVLRTGGIGQRGQGLLGGPGSRGAAGDHEGQSGAPKAVHEQLGELAVPVGHMRGAAFRQGTDDLHANLASPPLKANADGAQRDLRVKQGSILLTVPGKAAVTLQQGCLF